MKFYEFGELNKPVIILLPGTCCHWKANFEKVILPMAVRIRYSNTYFLCCENGREISGAVSWHFENPYIRHRDMQHEELLICNLGMWAMEVGKCCEI